MKYVQVLVKNSHEAITSDAFLFVDDQNYFAKLLQQGRMHIHCSEIDWSEQWLLTFNLDKCNVLTSDSLLHPGPFLQIHVQAHLHTYCIFAYIFGRRSALVKRVEHISIIVLVNISLAQVRVPLVLSVG